MPKYDKIYSTEGGQTFPSTLVKVLVLLVKVSTVLVLQGVKPVKIAI